MMEVMRKAAGTWVSKLLLLLLGVSFAAWGITGQMATGVGGNTVVKAGDTTVSTTQYRLAYDRQMMALSQQFGQRLTREQAKAFGVDAQALSAVVTGALLDEQARKLGLGLSKDGVATLTAEDPAFQGTDGKFDRQMFDYVLRQVGMRPQDYFDEQAKAAVRRQIVQAATGGLAAPQAFLAAMARYQGEDRTIDYLALPASIVPVVEDPKPEDLAAWFDANKQKYAAPEYRSFQYVKLEPEDIADPSAITDQQAADDYEARKAKYVTPESRAIEQLTFPNADAAKLALDQLRAGTTFSQLVQQAGKTEADISLGTLTKDKIPDQKIADAAFALSLNQVSDIVDGSFGPVLLRVTAVNPEIVKSLDEVKDDIRKELALAEANRVLLDSFGAYEDARAGGDTLAQAAEKLKLKVITVENIDRSAKKEDGTIVTDLPSSDELLAGVFETQAKVENQPINTRNNGYLFYEVSAVAPAHERPLDEVKDKVVTDWKAEQAAKRLEEKAAEYVKRLADGATLDALATELSLEKQTKRGVKRDADDPDIGRDGVGAVFDVTEGQSGQFLAPDRAARILFKVTEVTEPVGADGSNLPDEARETAARAVATDLLDDLVSRLRGEYDLQVNQAAMDRALLN